MKARRPCFECGAPAAFDHHVVPRLLGGTKTIPLCGACHEKVHGRRGTRTDHRALTVAGLMRVRARGGHVGRVGLGEKHTDRVDADGRRVVEADPEGRATAERIVILRAAGASMRDICKALDAEGRRTARGGRWQPGTVAKVLKRNGPQPVAA